MRMQAAEPAVEIAGSRTAAYPVRAAPDGAPKRVLVVEDSPSDAALVRRMLRDEPGKDRLELVSVGSAGAAVTALAARDTACVILDLGLPDAQGLDGLVQIRTAAPDAPIIVLTGRDDESVGLQALREGAQDYLTKGDVNAGTLRRSLRYAIERMRVDRQLHHLAYHDALTGLPNRMLFEDRVRSALARMRTRLRPGSETPVPRASRGHSLAAVMMVDLDRFKIVNDSLGHSAGDELLAIVAERMRAVLRPADTVARIGGDEFAVLCERINGREELEAITGRMLKMLRAPMVIGEHKAYIDASIGFTFATSPDDDPESLLRDADIALYRAKQAGRGRAVQFEAPMHAAAVTRHETQTDLHHALQRGELQAVYQPIVDVSRGTICGAEALLRWRHPRRGVLLPGDFLAEAEHSGLIEGFGAWTVRSALRQAREWLAGSVCNNLTVAVNMSTRELMDPKVVDTVAAALGDLGPGPDSPVLCLEITETSLVECPKALTRTLEALKELGAKLAVDNFGTRHATLDVVRRLPVDILKIDRALLSDVGSDQGGTAIVRALLTIGGALGLTVVAEGVETAEQLAALRELGCDMAQGHLFSAALPASEMRRLMARDPRW
ncbi:MAG: EAL domain-containing protein [Candidatus Dormibacteraeota bacterium]|nr:EAL domain-containing protein [Candidatus Dormibacteraeota bacterium]